MMWSDICSTYGVFDKSLKKMSPNHASVTKFGITWQAFSILRVLQPLFFSKDYPVQLSKSCAILHEQKSLTINRFQYMQVLCDECSTAMLKQVLEALQDDEVSTGTDLAGKNAKKGFPNKAQIRQVFSSELLRHLLKAYTMKEPKGENFKRIEDAIEGAPYKPDTLQNIWSHLATGETSKWIRLIDKALFYYVEYLVDFCRVNYFRKEGMRFIDILAKKKSLWHLFLRFDDESQIIYPKYIPQSESAYNRYQSQVRYGYAMDTGIFENSTQAKLKNEPVIGTDKKDRRKQLVSVPISFQDCLTQIAFQATHFEMNSYGKETKDKWWNMFDMSSFVGVIDPSASAAIKNRHKNLETEEPKVQNEDADITVGSNRKRLLVDLVRSYENKTKKHKTAIFERALNMVSVTCSQGNNEKIIAENEVDIYKEIFAEIKQTSEKSNEARDEGDSSSDESSVSTKSVL